MKAFLLAIPFLALMAGCSKDPGEGGKAEIRGRILEQQFNTSGNPTGDPYPLPEQNVYIIYGDGSEGAFPDDDVDSGADGTFRFKWLRKGSYTIYVISECDDCDGGTKAIYARTEIDGRKDVMNVGDLLVENY